MNFTHLHLHTQYSLLDGAILIPELIEHCKETGMTACAITDHGWMAGVVDFYKQCIKAEIKPILGVEAYITEDPDGLENEDKNRDNMHMVLLAKDNAGYRLLLDAVSNAALNNFYYKPRICKENLRKLTGHVVATSACLGGVLAKKSAFIIDQYGCAQLCHDEMGFVAANAHFYRDIFGPDFYLELQAYDDDTNHQQTYNQFLLQFGRANNFPFVITADCHYLRREDSKLHELLMAMQMKMTLEKYKELENMQYGPYFYVAPPEEMKERAESLECTSAYTNTQKIAQSCNVDIQLGKYQEPVFKIEETDDYKEFLKWKKNQSEM